MAQSENRPKRTKTAETEKEEEEQKRHLPTDLYEEILFRLRTNDLLKFKLVSKDWLGLISSPRFIRKHLYRSSANSNRTRILISLPTEIIDYNYYASGNNITKKIPYPPGFSDGYTMILGSWNGLICLLVRKSRKLGVLTPSTGESDMRLVDNLDINRIYFYWFGRHPSTEEYVLVLGRCFWGQGPMITVEIYKFSCKLKSVLSLSYPRLIVFRVIGLGTLLHGTLHWPAKGFDNNAVRKFIVFAYNFDMNKILEISAPVRYTPFTLGVVDRCLCVIHKSSKVFELWIMKEYGVEESWTKYKTIEGHENSIALSPLVFLPGGDLILYVNGQELTKYSFSEKKATLLNEYNRHWLSKAVVCVHSLVSPTLIWRE